MGLFDFFRRRRERESALGELSGGDRLQVPDKQRQPLQQNPAQPAGLEQWILQAIAQGNAQVDDGGNQVIDLRGTGLREQILGLMEQHGIDPEGGTGQEIDAASVPGLQEAILNALSEHGVDVGSAGTDAGGGNTDWSIGTGGDSSSSASDSGGSSSDSDSGGGGGGGDSGGGDSGSGGGSD